MFVLAGSNIRTDKISCSYRQDFIFRLKALQFGSFIQK